MAPAPDSESSPASSSSVVGGSSTISKHLSYPTPSDAPTHSTSPEQSRPLLKERLYVGNLHPTVDEYTLLQLFTKFGKVSKLDYLFHKGGPMKGKPRGYAFVEFADPNDAQKALATANDKLLRGRKLVITHAHQAPLDQAGGHGTGARYWRGVNDAGKPTTLSILKSAAAGRSDATEAKIAKMEAKLRQMEQSSSGLSASRLHPSLPPKPVTSPFPPSSITPQSSSQRLGSSNQHSRNGQTLPHLPIQNPPKSSQVPSPASRVVSPPHIDPPRKSIAPLSGVRIVKKKG